MFLAQSATVIARRGHEGEGSEHVSVRELRVGVSSMKKVGRWAWPSVGGLPSLYPVLRLDLTCISAHLRMDRRDKCDVYTE